MPYTTWLAPLALITAATIWGLIWYPYRLLELAGISGSLSSLLTYLVGALPLLLLVRHPWRLQPGQAGWLFAASLAAGWTNLSYVLAVIHGEVMRVMLLFYLAPLWTVFFARIFLGERTGRLGMVVIGLSIAGAWTMLQRGGAWPVPVTVAEWLGLSSGIGFALSNVLTRRLREVPIGLRALWVFLGVALISSLSLAISGEWQPAAHPVAMGGTTWLFISVIAVALLMATFAVQYGLAHTPANQAVVMLLSELVVAAISSRLLAGEVMSPQEWIGGAMIVTATLFSWKLSHD